MRNIGAYSINDILHAEGRNGIGPEGDVRIVGVNMQPLERLLSEGIESARKSTEVSGSAEPRIHPANTR
jgi:hypothetical protein